MANKPAYIAYSAVDQEGGKTRWREIGAAFHNSGATESITVLVDAVPLSGKIVLLPPKGHLESQPPAADDDDL